MKSTGLLFPLAAVLLVTLSTNFIVAAVPPGNGVTGEGTTLCSKDKPQCEDTEYCGENSRGYMKCQAKRGNGQTCNTGIQCTSTVCTGAKCGLEGFEENGQGGNGFPRILSALFRALKNAQARFGSDY